MSRINSLQQDAEFGSRSVIAFQHAQGCQLEIAAGHGSLQPEGTVDRCLTDVGNEVFVYRRPVFAVLAGHESKAVDYSLAAVVLTGRIRESFDFLCFAQVDHQTLRTESSILVLRRGAPEGLVVIIHQGPGCGIGLPVGGQDAPVPLAGIEGTDSFLTFPSLSKATARTAPSRAKVNGPV